MLAKYIRAQLALAGLSFAFYSMSMLVLKFPYAIALGALGGVLEFLPAVGWIASAAAILTLGFLTHSHWMWMAILLVVWRVVQDYVNSPLIYELISALWTHLPGWGWQAVNGVIASLMGVLVLAQWPVSGLWVIGLFVGIDLILYGWSWIALAFDLHKM
jgi:uncharacterized membrane protein HdeD (DUF308 family)